MRTFQLPDERVAYELPEQQYALENDMSSAVVQQKLRERQEQIRKEIRTAMKMKEGTEKMMRAATDRKVLSSAQNIIKEANAKLADLSSQLQEVEAFLLTPNEDVGYRIQGIYACLFRIIF